MPTLRALLLQHCKIKCRSFNLVFVQDQLGGLGFDGCGLGSVGLVTSNHLLNSTGTFSVLAVGWTEFPGSFCTETF